MTTAVLTRACEHCGEDFHPQRSDARFHSDTCRALASRARTEAKRSATVRSDNRSRTVIAVRAEPAPVLTWDPPSQPRGPYQTTDPCPDCGGSLWATLRGTRRACLACEDRVTPPGVTAAYDRCGTAAGRTVRSDDDRDDDALALAERASILLARISEVLDDDLHAASKGRLEWYAEQIKAAARAGQGTRVEKLAVKLAGERIRRQHWWNSDAPNPAAPIAGDQDDDDGEVWDAEVVDDGAPPGTEAPARAGVLDLAAELAARGYRLQEVPPGRCPVLETHSGFPQDCHGAADHIAAGRRFCQPHAYALTTRLRGKESA